MIKAPRKSPSGSGKRTTGKISTPKVAQPTKAEISTMLLHAQKKLMDAENAATALQVEISELREGWQTLEAEATEYRSAFYDREVDLRLLDNRLNETQTRAETAVTEMRHLTQLLAHAESKAQSLSKAGEEHTTALSAHTKTAAERDKALAENSVLRANLHSAQEAEKRLAPLEQRAAERDEILAENSVLRANLHSAQEAEKRLAPLEQRAVESELAFERHTRELADMAFLLEESESLLATQRAELIASFKTGHAIVSSLITPPNTDRMDSERLNRAAADLVAQGIIDPNWYLETYGDVADNNIDPALHFLEFGYAEGRAPRALESIGNPELEAVQEGRPDED